MVTLKLISTISLPCLQYAQEALSPTKTYIKSIEHPWSRAFMKIFNTFNEKTILQCQYYTGYLPLEHTVQLKKFNFLNVLKFSPNWLLVCLFELTAADELNVIGARYGVPQLANLSYNDMKSVIYNNFIRQVNQ